jgi:hypothetical protein
MSSLKGMFTRHSEHCTRGFGGVRLVQGGLPEGAQNINAITFPSLLGHFGGVESRLSRHNVMRSCIYNRVWRCLGWA